MRIVLIVFVCLKTAFGAATALENANTAYREGRFDTAVRWYDRALAAADAPALIYFNQANAYYQLDSLNLAVSRYQAAILDAPDFFRAYLNLGICFYEMDAWPSVVSTLETAQLLNPDHAQMLMLLALGYQALDKPGLAVVAMEKALAADSTLVDAHMVLFNILRALDDPDGAEKALQRYPDTAPRVSRKYRLLGDLALQRKHYADAALRYRRLIEIKPDNRWAWYRLTEAYNKGERPLLALDAAQRAVKRFPDFGALALLGGSIAFQAGFWKAAENLYSKAYRLGEGGGLVGLDNLKHTYRTLKWPDRVKRLNRRLAAILAEKANRPEK